MKRVGTWAFAFLLCNHEISIPTLCFTTTSSLSPSNSLKYRIKHQRHEISHLFVTSENSTPPFTKETSSEEQDNETNEPWWKSVTLQDSDLPLSTRSDFPILSTKIQTTQEDAAKSLIYLDSAATSQKPTFVTDALTNYYQTCNSNVHRGAHSLSREATQLYEDARTTIAEFINAFSRNEVAFTSGATEAINLVAMTYGRSTFQKGDEVIVSVMEHHSNIVPWQILKEELGIVLKFIPLTEDQTELDLKVFQSLVTEKTKMVSIQHASNVMGCIHPIEEISKYTRQHASPDCKIMIDACQSVPHMPVDVQQYDIDFMAASGHKICGPTGIGFLWGKEDLLNSMPPYQGGGEMIMEVFQEKSTYAPAPGRFEAGTPPIAQAVGFGAAIRYMNSIPGGMERVQKYELELGDYMYRRMMEVDGVRLLGPTVSTTDDDKNAKHARTAIVSFDCDGVHPSDLSTFLDMEGVAIRAGHHCCQPLHRELGLSHSARASLYFYNTKEEVDMFVEKLQETLEFFRGTANGVGEKDDDIFI